MNKSVMVALGVVGIVSMSPSFIPAFAEERQFLVPEERNPYYYTGYGMRAEVYTATSEEAEQRINTLNEIYSDPLPPTTTEENTQTQPPTPEETSSSNYTVTEDKKPSDPPLPADDGRPINADTPDTTSQPAGCTGPSDNQICVSYSGNTKEVTAYVENIILHGVHTKTTVKRSEWDFFRGSWRVVFLTAKETTSYVLSGPLDFGTKQVIVEAHFVIGSDGSYNSTFTDIHTSFDLIGKNPVGLIQSIDKFQKHDVLGEANILLHRSENGTREFFSYDNMGRLLSHAVTDYDGVNKIVTTKTDLDGNSTLESCNRATFNIFSGELIGEGDCAEA